MTRSHFFPCRWVFRIHPMTAASPSTLFMESMRNDTPGDKAKITAGAVTALVIVAWLAIIALAFLATG